MDLSTLDVVYLVARAAPGGHAELRMSLRSIAAHLPHNRVWLAGHRPAWATDVGHIPVAQHSVTWEQSRRVLHEACLADGPTETVILMHDDMYVMQPVDRIPTYTNGTLRDVLRHHKDGYYRRATLRTLELLRDQGIEEPPSYDRVHTPMVIHRPTMATLLAGAGYTVQYRTLYGATTREEGTPGADAKRATPDGATWLSTDLPRGPVWEHVTRTLTTPGPYEREPTRTRHPGLHHAPG